MPPLAGIRALDGTLRRRALQTRAEEEGAAATIRLPTAASARHRNWRKRGLTTNAAKRPERFNPACSLRRWSQRKREAARRELRHEETIANAAQEKSDHAAEKSGASPPDAAAVIWWPQVLHRPTPAADAGASATLPPLESLTIDSDFSPFMRPRVDAALKRGGLKQLFSDPHFNVMDGLDIYVGDYSIARSDRAGHRPQLVQARYIFNPPATRVNAQGHVADVPDPLEAGNHRGERAAADAVRRARRGGDANRCRRSRRRRESAAPTCHERCRAVSRPRIPPPRGAAQRRSRKRGGVIQLIDKTVSLCTCNATMPLDPEALGRATGIGGAPAAHGDVPEEPRRDSRTPRAATCWSDARRSSGCSARPRDEPVRALRSASSTFAKPPAGLRKPPRATPRSPRCWPPRRCPIPNRCRASATQSEGQVLIVGPLEAALRWADALAPGLSVTVLATQKRTSPRGCRPCPDISGRLGPSVQLDGWLGAFDAQWSQENPVDLDVCTRCNACVTASARSSAIDEELPDRPRRLPRSSRMRRRLRRHRRDRLRSEDDRAGRTFRPRARLAARAGARAAPAAAGLLRAGRRRRGAGQGRDPARDDDRRVLETKYFAYKASICAHSRSRKVGCTACIDVCSTQAIRADGDGVAVEPHLCMGCGACATVCPSGAMTYAYPAMTDQGARVAHAAGDLRARRRPRRDAAGPRPRRRETIARIARRGRGLPARVIPFEVHHVASTGLDLWMAALAWGASGVDVIATGDEAPQYREALASRCASAHDRRGAGLPGRAFPHRRRGGRRSRARAVGGGAALGGAWPRRSPRRRKSARTLAFALDHLALHAPVRQGDSRCWRARRSAPRRGPRPLHDVPCVRRTVPGGRDARPPRDAQAAVHRVNCVQCGLCAKPAPRTPSPSCRGWI